MGKEFFTDWETWEKLVFVLACAIVVTISLGCGKLAYTHWRLRKYSIIEREKQEHAIHRRMSQRQRSQRAGNDTVPFGIRALESGIEIEGVWISPCNTPEQLSRESSAASGLWDRIPMSDPIMDLDKHGSHQSPNFSARRSVTDTEQLNQRYCNQAGLQSHCQSGQKFPADSLVSKPAKSRHPPLSYTRYQGNPYILRRQSSATNTLQGLEAIHKASTCMHDPHSGGSTDSSFSSNYSMTSASDLESISASAPHLLSGQQNSKPRQGPGSDFELLNSHRNSQAAETGQLTPRGRPAGKAYSADFVTPSARTLTTLERSALFGVQHEPAQNPHEASRSNDRSLSAKPDARPSSPRRSSMPNAIPFTQFCKMAPPSPPLENAKSNSFPSAITRSDDWSEYDVASSSPIMLVSEGAAELRLPPPERGSFEKLPVEILRGRGTGFEILRPGSFHPVVQNEHRTAKPKNAPPVSLHNASQRRSSSFDSQRKLQKKQRFSVGSLSSSRASQGSQTSLL